MKNKKGDLPITLLVMGVLAVCIFALLTFYITDTNKRGNAFSGLDKIQEANINLEQGTGITQIGGRRVVEETNVYSPWFGEDVVLFRVRYFLD